MFRILINCTLVQRPEFTSLRRTFLCEEFFILLRHLLRNLEGHGLPDLLKGSVSNIAVFQLRRLHPDGLQCFTFAEGILFH